MKKYPLKWYHEAGREFVCWLKGHQRKTSWHRKANYDELIEIPDDEFSYGQRHSGNPYYEYVSQGWQIKCRRCRWQTRDTLRDSFHVRWYRYIISFFRSWWIAFTCDIKYGAGIKRYFLAPIAGIVFALIQTLASRGFTEHNGVWMLDGLYAIEDRVHGWVGERPT